MRIESIKQTPFVSYDNKNLFKIRISDWDACNPFNVDVYVDDKLEFSKTISTDTFDALVPISEQPKAYHFMVTPFEGIPVHKYLTLKMPKQWKISILYSSHEDLGFCAYMDKLDHDFYTYLLKAMDLCESIPGFKYLIEHYEWLRGFERYATEEECERLKALFDAKKVELNAIECGVHSHWSEASQLIENVQLATEVSAKKWGIPVQTAIYADISGLTEQCISAYSNQGIRYIGILYNRYRRLNYNGEIPFISRWTAPNGKDSVLLWNVWAYRCPPLRVWCGSKRFDHTEFYFDETKSLQTEQAITEMIENLGDVPYSTYPVSYYDDHEVPSKFLHTVCEYMNKKWKYPHFAMELPSVFLSEIEAQYGDKIPVLTGDISDQWADGYCISPDWASVKRKAMREKNQASLMDTLSAIETGSAYPEDVYREVSRLGAVFDEHCWPCSAKHPLRMHLYNTYYVKKYSADKAAKLVSERMQAHLGKPNNDKMGLYNLLPQSRNGGLKLSVNEPIPDGIKCQRLPDGKIITEAINLSAMSCKNCSVRTKEVLGSVSRDYSFETNFYSVKVNSSTCQIESIFDKTLGKELIDANAPFGFGEYVYTVAEGKESSALNYEPPKENEISVEEGDVAYVVYKKSFEEQSSADVYTTFIFYKNDRAIDVDLRYENATALMGDSFARYKRSIFISFPFNVENYSFYTQTAGGGAHSEKEKVQASPLDYSIAENWVSVEGNGMGIGLLSKDMPLFEFGDINMHKFMPKAKYPTSHIYMQAVTNKMNSLNYNKPEYCHASFEISILPYQGSWKENMQQWSMEKVYSPILGKPSDKEINGITLDRNVRILSVKPATLPGNEILITLAEVNGKDENGVQITLPFNPKAVYYTDLNGNVKESAQYKGNKVIFDMPSLSYTVLKIQGDFFIKAAPVQDAEIFDVVTVEVTNHDSIVSFEKAKGLKAKSFKIYGDGELLVEVENSKRLIERVELKGRYKDVKIEVCK